MPYPDNFDSLAFDRHTRTIITHADCREYEDTREAVEALEALFYRIVDVAQHHSEDCGTNKAAREAWEEAHDEAELSVLRALNAAKTELACIEARFTEADVELPV